jgi:hypothetical protein
MLKKEYLLRSTNVGFVLVNSYSLTENSSQDKDWKDSDFRLANWKLHRVLFYLNLHSSLFIQYAWGCLHDVSFLTINTLISMPSPGIAYFI